MTFVDVLKTLPVEKLVEESLNSSVQDVEESLRKSTFSIVDFAHLISPGANGYLEKMANLARSITLRRFGKVVRLFAPLYVSNECINNCKYCGFSRDNGILRVTLAID